LHSAAATFERPAGKDKDEVDGLTYQGWIALAVTAAVFAALQRKRGAPVDLLFLGGLAVVTLTGVITPEQALSGFASNAVLTIAALFVVAAGLRSTGVLDWVGEKLLGQVETESRALRRLALTVVPVSAFLLNTPLVAMLVPVVIDWCRKRGVSPSRLLMPLSYLVILGGVCTLIGTSTTLVVNEMLLKTAASGEWQPSVLYQLRSMQLFELGKVGLPCAVVGTLYILSCVPRLVPDRTELVERLGDKLREYVVEMLVQPECPLIGRTVQAAGLRHLPGLFLIEIDRDGETITPVTPNDLIHAQDRLVFAGIVTTIADLERIPGLVPAADMTYEIHPSQRHRRELTEAVLSRSSPVIGRTVRQANFRRRYNAAIVAVHRNGERLTSKIGDTRLEPGDTILLQTRSDFTETYRNSRDFYLISRVGGSRARRHDRAFSAVVLLLVLIGWLTASSWISATGPWGGFSSTAIAGITVAGAMIVCRCLPVSQARTAFDLQVLITIAAAIGLGSALETSGAAASIAGGLVQATQTVIHHPTWTPLVLLAAIYLMTLLFTETITNVAVATMLLPLAIRVAVAAECNARPYVMAVALAASLSFVTPIGYQTNLMVMGPGGYRPRDYLRVGSPLAALVFITAMIAIPLAFPLK